MALKCVNKQGIKNWMLGLVLLLGTSVFSQPTITNFSPNSGPIGTLVTISGTNLSNPTGITIAGVSAIPISNNGNTLVAMVMPGATTGGVSVTTSGGTANGSGNFLVTSSQVPNTQQGNKLVGTGAVWQGSQGSSVSISADGNTAIVGGDGDNGVGAAWIYTLSGGVWTQQGNKLVGTGSVGPGYQGFSVSISADGNTAIVGSFRDNNFVGAAWVYTRSGGVWTQQGNKLVGTGAVGSAYQGWSVSISADGNTAIVGGYNDNSNVGAAWVYTRSGGVWTQQGNKLVGTGSVGQGRQGSSVSISADGNTAIVGGDGDNGVGA
ncbi:MAG: IPT/TIG domain-containing protein, partial [Chitinophagaceae bacterium]|nr:IPT/TIG domain-containing protein [Chitinophagaceae bacterium]